MRVDIPKDNPNMTCQAVPLQSQFMVSNHPDHDPPSRPDATPVLSHRPPPPTRTHLEPPPRSWSTTRAQCQGDTGSATSTTISPHNSESATLSDSIFPSLLKKMSKDMWQHLTSNSERPIHCFLTENDALEFGGLMPMLEQPM
ncbi:unnamed protein product [Pleuronectes platessa]|uniref:Uncharacterized protein n=1 Tax=Pleuronectes platessa TaxID=8262 RepID=A0A9N7Z9F0_PLEPL|nr:unnamed protein product [Pleuronectes platessa]